LINREKKGGKMASEEFPEIKEELKTGIEEVLKKARAEHFTSEALEIYSQTFKRLRELGPDFLRKQKLFPFEDTILAWVVVLKELGLVFDETNVGRRELTSILLGVIWATINERSKEKEV
jgi:hypothetical protein